MQKLKPEVREKILANALIIFYKKGFENTTMRRIAAKSHMTVGNIYRYFKNKEVLFDEVIMDVYVHIYEIVINSANKPVETLVTSEYLNDVLITFSNLCEKYPKQIVIFITRYLTLGSYPLFKRFEDIVQSTLKASNPHFDETTTKLLTYLLLHGVLFTLQNHKPNNIRHELTIFFNILFRDTRGLVTDEKNL